jgi:hypothetical protein
MEGYIEGLREMLPNNTAIAYPAGSRFSSTVLTKQQHEVSELQVWQLILDPDY